MAKKKNLDITETGLYKRMKERISCILHRCGPAQAPDDFLSNPDLNLVNDYGLDDLDEVEAIITLEEEFGIYISEDDVVDAKTMRDYYNILLKKGVKEDGRTPVK